MCRGKRGGVARFLVLKGKSEREFSACFIGRLLGSILVHPKPQNPREHREADCRHGKLQKLLMRSHGRARSIISSQIWRPRLTTRTVNICLNMSRCDVWEYSRGRGGDY